MTGRIRTIKPEWLEDELLANASNEARVLSVGLILMADDYGRGRANIATIASDVWRFAMARDDGAHAAEVLAMAARAFRELVAMRFVIDYEVDRQRYFAIRNWTKHQKVDRPSRPRIPAPLDTKTPDRIDTRENLASVSRGCDESLASVSRGVDETLAIDSRLTCTSDLIPVPTTPTPATTTGPLMVDESLRFPEPGAEPFNERDLERAVSEVRGTTWKIPVASFHRRQARETAALIMAFAHEHDCDPHAVARAAYDAWQKASKSIDPMVWCANWAAKLPPPPKPKEPYRDLEG
jgi:hypothetical protein